MIKRFSLFESQQNIKDLCDTYGIRHYTIHSDNSISVNGDVDLSGVFRLRDMSIPNDNSISVNGDVDLSGVFRLRDMSIPNELPIKFREVSGYFNCCNSQLTSLYNFPNVIGDSLDCSMNRLTSLEYCPKEVGGHFYCHDNYLESLEGCPEVVGDFRLNNNRLISLKHGPKKCGSLNCSYNKIESLEGCPEIISGFADFNNNKISNFDGLPEFFEQGISLYNNPINEIYRLFYGKYFENPNPEKSIYYLREFGVIQGNTVVRDRLEEVFHTLRLDIPDYIELKSYNLV